MKTGKYQRRFYRNWIETKDLHQSCISFQESDLQILTDKPLDKPYVESKLHIYRHDIELYITRDRRFLTALKPLEVELTAKPIVREMSKAAKSANVGPMAAVAGAIAQFLGKDLLKRGYRDVIIENGGDIFLASRKVRTVCIYTGRPRIWGRLSLRIKPRNTPIGICTSSGTIGHSLSFGCADSVVIVSKNALLADAAATAVANHVKSKYFLREAIHVAQSIHGVLGAVIIFKNNLISWGSIEFSR